MIQIDTSRCVLCGMCARVCAAHCFHLTEKAVHVRHEEYCMHCGHCTAVCPKAAVTLDGVNRLRLERGCTVVAMFKASNVLVAVKK